jgi:phosphate transport system ATP-binding protein
MSTLDDAHLTPPPFRASANPFAPPVDRPAPDPAPMTVDPPTVVEQPVAAPFPQSVPVAEWQPLTEPPPEVGWEPLAEPPPVVGWEPLAEPPPVVDLRVGAAEPAPAAAPGAHLEAVALSQWFSGRKVLERCSLTMEPSRVTALIGPSGCGKSTFLRALNRMHELVPGAELAGKVLLNGDDIYSEDVSPTEVRLRIGMVFQKPNPFPAMSIADNVLAGLSLSGSNTEDPVGLVEQCLRRAGLWNEVKDRLHEGGMSLSGGQQQRLCIARSLAVHPDVLLMDEPCSALDPISTRVIEQTIRELCEDITIVIVTHNMQQAQRVSDDCAFFLVEELGQPGRIVESGLTQQMFDAPRDPRTLDYVSGRFG